VVGRCPSRLALLRQAPFVDTTHRNKRAVNISKAAQDGQRLYTVYRLMRTFLPTAYSLRFLEGGERGERKRKKKKDAFSAHMGRVFEGRAFSEFGQQLF